MNPIHTNISPLAFYDSVAEQNHRKDYAFGQIYPLLTDSRLLPFQVIVPRGVSIGMARIHNVSTGQQYDVTNQMIALGLRIDLGDGDMLPRVVYPATDPINPLITVGRYYLLIGIAGYGTIYSDIFTVCSDMSRYLQIEYTNSYNLDTASGVIDFDDFTFRCYLDTQIGKPEYQFEEEATERMGYTFVETQMSKKVYKFTFLSPEYLCDALRIVRLCDSKKITSKGREYDLTTFNMNPTWEEQGDLAVVECEFETDTVIANIGGYRQASGGIGGGSGDFNIDFNNDFL